MTDGPVPPITPAAGAPIRVLLADDQPLLRTGFKMVLGAETDLNIVGEAGNGAEAVDLARRLLPDVVLMDIRMPRLDGVAATRQIIEAKLPVRVLILTTFDLDEYVVGALRAGASGFLAKDVADVFDQLVALQPQLTKDQQDRLALALGLHSTSFYPNIAGVDYKDLQRDKDLLSFQQQILASLNVATRELRESGYPETRQRAWRRAAELQWDMAGQLLIVARALRADGKLLVIERIIPPGNEPCFGKLADLNLLVMYRGRHRTEAEYRTPFARAGFALSRIIPTNSPTEFSVIEGVPR